MYRRACIQEKGTLQNHHGLKYLHCLKKPCPQEYYSYSLLLMPPVCSVHPTYIRKRKGISYSRAIITVQLCKDFQNLLFKYFSLASDWISAHLKNKTTVKNPQLKTSRFWSHSIEVPIALFVLLKPSWKYSTTRFSTKTTTLQTIP